MYHELLQGDIIKVEKIKFPVLVLSKDFFNRSGEIIGCPIYTKSTASPLHIAVSTSNVQGYAQCEKLALLDMQVRGYTWLDKLALEDKMNITDAVQGIFDYV